jgi:hypothetical protein
MDAAFAAIISIVITRRVSLTVAVPVHFLIAHVRVVAAHGAVIVPALHVEINLRAAVFTSVLEAVQVSIVEAVRVCALWALIVVLVRHSHSTQGSRHNAREAQPDKLFEHHFLLSSNPYPQQSSPLLRFTCAQNLTSESASTVPNGVSRSIQGRTFWWTLNILPVRVNLAQRIRRPKGCALSFYGSQIRNALHGQAGIRTHIRRGRQSCGAAVEYNAVKAVAENSAGRQPQLRPSIITYDGLPLSSGGGHTLRTRDPLAARDQVRNFLSCCTDCGGPQKASIEVITGGSVPAEFSLPLVKKLSAELGVPARRGSYGSGAIAHSWPIAPAQVDGFVAHIAQAIPLPVLPFRLQPLTVTAAYKFHLLDPRSRATLPWQNPGFYGNFSTAPGQFLGESQIYARISERSTVSLFLSFPFDDVSEELITTAGFVRAHLPFPLSANHWKRWRLAIKGKGYVGRRIDPEMLGAINGSGAGDSW